MSENLKSLEDLGKVVILAYGSVALIIMGLAFYYLNWWTLYLSVVGVLIYLPCARRLSKRKANPKINFHFWVITIINGIAFLFLFVVPYFLGSFK